MEESKEIPMYRDEKKEYQLEQILNKIEEADGIVKTSDILALGIDYRRVQTFVKEGELRKIRNGSYTSGRKSYPEEDLITGLFPDGVLTLQSALFAYGYLDEMPEVWQIAISKNTSKSRFNILYPSVEPSYTEDDVLLMGQEKIQLGHREIAIYSRDRLICDVLKYQDKLTTEEFKKAIRGYVNDEKKDVTNLMKYAISRKVRQKVQNVISIWL